MSQSRSAEYEAGDPTVDFVGLVLLKCGAAQNAVPVRVIRQRWAGEFGLPPLNWRVAIPRQIHVSVI